MTVSEVQKTSGGANAAVPDVEAAPKLGLDYLFRLYVISSEAAQSVLTFLLKSLFVVHGAAIIVLMGFSAQLAGKDLTTLNKVANRLSEAITWYLFGLGSSVLAALLAWMLGVMSAEMIHNQFKRAKTVQDIEDVAKLIEFNLINDRRIKDRWWIFAYAFAFILAILVPLGCFVGGGLSAIDVLSGLGKSR